MELKLLHPFEFAELNVTYEATDELIDISKKYFDMKMLNTIEEQDIENFRNFFQEYLNYFDLDELSKWSLDNIKSSFFKKGKFEKLDKLQKELDNNIHYLDDLERKLSEEIAKREGKSLDKYEKWPIEKKEMKFKKKKSDDNEENDQQVIYYFLCSNRRGKLLE